MKIKKFIAKSMQEALKMVKQEFGNDAIILNNKKINENNVEVIEVTAAIDKQTKNESHPKANFQKTYYKANEKAPIPQQLSNTQLLSMQKDISFISTQVDLLVNHIKYKHLSHIPKNLQHKVKQLTKGGVSSTIANKIVDELFLNMKGEDFLNIDEIEQKILYKLKNLIKVSGPIKFHRNYPTVIPFVGPTGVGKTTVVAKLAAQYKFIHDKKVIIVSSDCYRIAAMEQLKSFADITKIPFMEIYKNEDIPEQFLKLRDYDLILVDTAGINIKDMKKMIVLKELIRVTKADTLYLVLSLNTRTEDLRDAIKNFSFIKNTSLIFTKVDETNYFGDLLNLSAEFEKGISYLSIGQNIPEDIKLADRMDIATMIINGKMR